jgi:choline dehydrogenase
MRNRYDYIVIGGGTAGSVLASRLSEGAHTVLLLEAGPAVVPNSTREVDGFPGSVLGTELDWAYATLPQPGTAGTAHVWSAGRTLGGGSAINAMAHIRGHASTFDSWAQRGAFDWSHQELLPYYKRSETASGRDSTHRGVDGPLVVAPLTVDHAGAVAFRQAVLQAGYPGTDDINGRDQLGAFTFDMNVVDGRRQSAADAYLRPVMDRDNLDVIDRAVVHRLRVQQARCVSVEFVKDGVMHDVHVDREALLASGAIGSPKILMLSGIGPAEHLRAIGIDVVLDLPGVGSNLQDHVQSRVIYSAKKPMRSASNGFCRNAALLRSGRSVSPAPDVFLMLIDFPAPAATLGSVGAIPIRELAYTIAFSQQSPPLSRGVIRLAGVDPDLPPVVDPRYYANEADLSAMLAFLDIARAVGAAEALSPWRDSELWPGRHHEPNELRDYLRRSSGTSYHPVGTCQMGTGVHAVVGSDLRVHGLSGLRVVDASVMPEIVNVNTNATVVAIAERAAEWILTS